MAITVPASYTDSTLGQFMVTVLGETGVTLGLTYPDDFDEIVEDTLVLYGVRTVAEATDIKKLRKLAELSAWRRALSVVVGDYDFSDAGVSYKRSQIYDHIKNNIELLLKQAIPLISDYYIVASKIDWKNDPYEYHEAGTYTDVPR
jgi:hypothetical protein